MQPACQHRTLRELPGLFHQHHKNPEPHPRPRPGHPSCARQRNRRNRDVSPPVQRRYPPNGVRRIHAIAAGPSHCSLIE
jgi:hypothetical protein